MRFNYIGKLVALGGLALLGTVTNAATVLCPGALVAPLNRQIEVTGALTGGYCAYKVGNVNGDDFSVFAGFPSTYSLLDKDIAAEDPPGGNSEGSLFYTRNAGGTAGTWEMTSNFWQTYERMFIAFHFGGGGPSITPDSFVVELGPQAMMGDWALLPSNLARGLSNIYLLGTGTCKVNCGDDDDDDTDLPEPGSLALLGLGLLGLGVSRRRKN